MSKRKSRPYTTAAIILVGGTLIAFFLYMWNYDYKVSRPKEFTLKRDLRGMLRIDQKGEYGYSGPVAIVTLANASQGRVRLLDTKNLHPLYALKLAYKSETGETKELAMRPDVARRLAREESEPFDKDNDAVAELVTGAAYTRAIPLTHYYDMKESGNYELTVTYNPEKVAVAMGQSFDFLEVTREVLSVPVKFRYPEETAPANAEKAEKTPSTNSAK
jgi:hypothetical protein